MEGVAHPSLFSQGKPDVDLQEFFDGSEIGHPRIAEGELSEWLWLGELEIESGSLWAGDPHFFSQDDGCVVEVPSGRYVVEATVLSYKEAKVVSQLRVVLKGELYADRGAEIDTTGTDSAVVGVADRAGLLAVLEEHTGAGPEALESAREWIQGATGEPPGLCSHGGKELLAYVPTGSDGAGPVFELFSHDRSRVGVELEFIRQKTRIRCPVEACTGFVVDDSDDQWVCEGCGDEWEGRGELDDAIQEIIDGRPHREACYEWSGEHWRPASQEPSDYEERVRHECDEESDEDAEWFYIGSNRTHHFFLAGGASCKVRRALLEIKDEVDIKHSREKSPEAPKRSFSRERIEEDILKNAIEFLKKPI